MTYPTIIDIAASTGDDGIAAVIEEVIKAVPEVQMGAARTIKGTQYKATIRTALPTAGFRNANEGAVASKSRYEQRLFDCFITDQPWLCDKAVADAHEDGKAAYIASEAKAIVEAQTIMLGKQFYYGLSTVNTSLSDAKGFPGLEAQYDATNMTVDATGSTAGTGSSVWAVSWGDEGAQFLYGNGSNPLQLTDIKEVVLPDPNNSNGLITYYHQQLLAWVGLKLGSLKRVARIKNLTEDSGKTLNDRLLQKLIRKFPVGYKPDALFMTKRSMEQWVNSRTVSTPTAFVGAVPTSISEYEGIPVVLTDSIQDTEVLS